MTLCVGDREARADCQCGELIDRILAGAPVRKLLFVNGGIALGVREASQRCHCGKTTASRALARLQTAGFISIAYKGHLVPDIGRPDVATRWKRNFLKNHDSER